jgi:regulator of sigma E protease
VENDRLEKPSVVAMQDFIKLHAGQDLALTFSGTCEQLNCEKKLTTKQLRIRTPQETPAGQGALGVMFQEVVFLKYTWYELPFRATYFAFSQSFEMIGLIWKALGDMVHTIFAKGNVPSELSGPIGIAYDFQQNNVVSEGLPSILGFMAALSINLGVMNMLPIPALDGGRALFVVLEEIFGKKRTSKIEHYAHLGGYIFLLTLIVLISARDVWRIISDLLM